MPVNTVMLIVPLCEMIPDQDAQNFDGHSPMQPSSDFVPDGIIEEAEFLEDEKIEVRGKFRTQPRTFAHRKH